MRTIELILNDHRYTHIFNELEELAANMIQQNLTSDSKIVQSLHQGSVRQLVTELIMKDTNKWWSMEVNKRVEDLSLHDYELPDEYVEKMKDFLIDISAALVGSNEIKERTNNITRLMHESLAWPASELLNVYE